MNRTTRAQRRNARIDQIWDKAQRLLETPPPEEPTINLSLTLTPDQLDRITAALTLLQAMYGRGDEASATQELIDYINREALPEGCR